MAGFQNFRTLVENRNRDGKVMQSNWFKNPTASTFNRTWIDFASSPGNPSPIYYAGAPLTALPLAYSTDGGIYHGHAGGSQSVYLTKLLNQVSVTNPCPMYMILCDLLMAYPFCDEGTSDVQSMTNTQTLPRYTTGDGVQVMAVSVAPPSGSGGATFVIEYTNSAGVSGRISPTVTMNIVTANGQLISAVNGSAVDRSVPFLPLQAGDSGVRSIQSVTMTSGSDVGLFTLVLVKPLADAPLYGFDAPYEQIPYIHKSEMIEIKNDACLGYIANLQGNVGTGRIQGTLEFVWT